jgi:heme/copper-type cytochrome/quinol oxidase subunit 3
VSISLAVAAVRRERQRAFRGWLAATLGIAAAFVLVQAPSLGSILVSHLDQLRAAAGSAAEGVARPPMALLGLIFFLIVVHALHVVGGIVALGWVLYRAGQNAYDHEHYLPIRHTALYWHFLDVVWLVMFGTMLLLG